MQAGVPVGSSLLVLAMREMGSDVHRRISSLIEAKNVVLSADDKSTLCALWLFPSSPTRKRIGGSVRPITCNFRPTFSIGEADALLHAAKLAAIDADFLGKLLLGKGQQPRADGKHPSESGKR